MRVHWVCRANGKEVTCRIRMFGASLISREFNSWSTRPKPEPELRQDALQINQKDQLHLVCYDRSLLSRRKTEKARR